MNHHFFNWINKTLAKLFKPNESVDTPTKICTQVVDLDERQNYKLIYIKVNTTPAITKIDLCSLSRTITIVVNKKLGKYKPCMYYPDVPEGVLLNARQSIPVLMQSDSQNLMVTLTRAHSKLGFDIELSAADTTLLDETSIPEYKHVNTNVLL